MKKSDVIAGLVVGAVVAIFSLVPGVMESFKHLSSIHGFVMSFVKFAVLATFGECLALRITEGVYNRRGFGVLSRMIVWGLLGMLIKAAFVIFLVGVPALLVKIGFASLAPAGTHPFLARMLNAFMVSVFLNLVFAPVMMTLHKITDMHIAETGGTLSGFFSPINFAGILRTMNWDVMWHFVFKKTIPFFWIPAHTITFMLPSEFQVLFAAFLGIMLGLILAFAGNRTSRKHCHTAPA